MGAGRQALLAGDDERHGIPFIERALALGVAVICVHKGLPLFGFDYEYSTCRDIGAVARLYPDMTFVVYHSGYEPWCTEAPYDPARAERGWTA
jgi:predicted TIM-barrel fold metal-dependent hydrolase